MKYYPIRPIKPMNEIKDFFDKCKIGELGVMPYSENQKIVTFVGTNGKGYGRIFKLTLSKEGQKEAYKFYLEIRELNQKETSHAN
jgi:hypothetical protein